MIVKYWKVLIIEKDLFNYPTSYQKNTCNVGI